MPTRQELEAQYRSEEKRANRVALFKRIALWGGLVIGLVAMVYGLAKLGAEQSKPNSGVIADPIDSSDWAKGNALSKNTLIEYGDFQCPGCASIVPFVNELEKKYGNQLRIVYRNYPLRQIHPFAQISAQAAEAAGKQGKYWEMYALLFANQSTWSSSNKPQSIFEGYAGQLQLNIEKFTADMQSSEIANKIDRDVATGDRAGVRGTPSFYLNDRYVNYESYEQLEQLIKQAIGQ